MSSGPGRGRRRSRSRSRWRTLPLGVRRRVRILAIAAAVVVVAALILRLPAALVAVLVVSTVALGGVAAVIPAEEPLWAPPREEPYRLGWQHLSLLAHDIAVAESSPWQFDAAVRPRLRRIAGAALTRRGVDWDTPAAADALGAGLHAALSGGPITGDSAGAGARTALARATLDAVRRLDDTTITTTTTEQRTAP